MVMSGRLSSVVLIGLSVIAVCIGCSVKEDRSVCPCVVMLDLSRVDPDRSDSLSLSLLSADGFLHRCTIHCENYGYVYEVPVPKGKISANVYSVESGFPDFTRMTGEDGASLSIPYGEECPAVNMFSSCLDASGETLAVPVVLHKNYCVLTVSMVADEGSDFRLVIEGNVDGYGVNGGIHYGGFSFDPVLDENGSCTVRIPRQSDGSLKLLISDGDGVLREFAIGEYIIESGYDWSAPDLEDVSVMIDYAKTDVTFVVNDWEVAFDIDVEI